MQLVILRILFGAALLFVLREAIDNARAAPMTGDGTNAVLLALGLFVALANAAVWAPYFGSKLSAPLTLPLTEGSVYERRTRLLDLARRAERMGRRRLAAGLCLVESFWRPNQPAAFLMGLKNARPGSWFETYCALRVFRFDNASHSLDAYRILRKHGIDPRPHKNPEINALLLALERRPTPAPAPILLTSHAEIVVPRRDPRIRLFGGSSEARRNDLPTKAEG
jgi:hypothetical protein